MLRYNLVQLRGHTGHSPKNVSNNWQPTYPNPKAWLIKELITVGNQKTEV